MKKLHKLLILSFLRPFMATFFIVSFILVMVFMFKYSDELVGKGLGVGVILQLIFYNFINNIPQALPLAILLASIMTFGDLGEHYELVAIKASGISLARALVPLLGVMIFMSCAAFYISNIVSPKALWKMAVLLYDARQKKAVFSIPEGVFYNDLEGYSIRVDKKDKDEKTLHALMIYDHTKGDGNLNVIMAEKGEMYKSDDGRYLILNLFDGIRYEEMPGERTNDVRERQVRIGFKEFELKFDLSGFSMSRTREELFGDAPQLLNVSRLLYKEDSLHRVINRQEEHLQAYVKPSFMPFRSHSGYDTISTASVKQKAEQDFLQELPLAKQAEVVNRALSSMRYLKSFIGESATKQADENKRLRRHTIEFHKKFTLSIACIVLFFIGAPMGAIVRKGGLGLPVIISILFFLIFHTLNITGEKSAREGVWLPWEGIWLAPAILIPVGIFLTYKAATDSVLFDVDKYTLILKRFFAKNTQT